MLRSIEVWARTVGLSTVFVTAAPGGVLTRLGELLHDRLSQLSPESLSDRLRAAFTKVGVKVGPAEVSLDLSRSGAVQGAAAAMKETVAAVACSPPETNRGVVLFIDEFQDVPLDEIRTIATAWQELSGEAALPGGRPVPAALILAGLSNVHDRITEAASFGERFKFDTLGNLNPDAAAQALLQPAHERGVTWDEALLTTLLGETAGYPYFLQLYAHEVWNARPRRRGDRLGMDDLGDARETIAREVEMFYRGRWQRATAAEQRILEAIARSGRDELARGEIAKIMGVKSTDLSMARASLLGKGILAVPRRGVLAFNAPGFGDFILEELD